MDSAPQPPAEAQSQGGWDELLALLDAIHRQVFGKPYPGPIGTQGGGEVVAQAEQSDRRTFPMGYDSHLHGLVTDNVASALLCCGIENLPAGVLDTIASEIVRGYHGAPQPASGGEVVYGLFRAIVDAGGPETIARHGVERGSREWTAKVRAGLLAIERQFHPERFDEPAPSAPVGVEGLVTEMREAAARSPINNGVLHYWADKLEALAQQPAASAYVECRQCRECDHIGLNDSAAGKAACHECEWSGQEPTEDRCPECDRTDCMGAACPKCGELYLLAASVDVPAQQPAAVDGAQAEAIRARRHQIGRWLTGLEHIAASCEGRAAEIARAALAAHPGGGR